MTGINHPISLLPTKEDPMQSLISEGIRMWKLLLMNTSEPVRAQISLTTGDRIGFNPSGDEWDYSR